MWPLGAQEAHFQVKMAFGGALRAQFGLSGALRALLRASGALRAQKLRTYGICAGMHVSQPGVASLATVERAATSKLVEESACLV